MNLLLCPQIIVLTINLSERLLRKLKTFQIGPQLCRLSECAHDRLLSADNFTAQN